MDSVERFSDTEYATRIEHNRIYNNQFAGVAVFFSPFNRHRIVGNDIHHNGTGMFLEQGDGVVRANRLSHNGVGIAAHVVEKNGFAILGNTVRDSGSYGLGAFLGDPNEEAPGLRLENNSVLRSGQLDCVDSTGPVPGRWVNNIGATANPRAICRPPPH